VNVEEYVKAAREAWPEITIDVARFASEIERRGTPVEAVKGLDLYLAIACTDGNERAIEAVRKLLVAEVGFAASKTTATKEQLADVTGALSHVLFVDEEERPAALRSYSGRGDLKSYLRVIAMRELMKVVNRGRKEVFAEDDDFIDRIVPPSDPELSMLRERYRGDVDEAMKAALATLDERERALLRYAFVDGWNVDAVGKVYGVHRATAARWISAARESLGTRIREQLAARLRVDVDDVDSIVRLVQSRIDVSLDRVLKS
jgi:RNA polymerase sigma-70 factor (ECF subfamily)